MLSSINPLVLLLVCANLCSSLVWNYFIKTTGGFSFSQPVATAICAYCALFGTITFAKILHQGVNLSLLLPILGALGGLMAISIGVFVYGENASPAKVGLLLAALCITALASKF